jgi:hypothetical protein
MEFEDVLNRLDSEGTRGRFMTESFLLNLLKLHIESQGKRIFIDSGPKSSMFDAFAPDGFDEYNGPLYIEITPVISLRKLIWRIEKQLNHSNTINKNSGLLILSMRPLSEKFLVEAHHNAGNFDIPVYIWGPKDIENIAVKHSEDVKRLVENLFSLRFESAIKKEQANWKEARNRVVDDVKRTTRLGYSIKFSFCINAYIGNG